MELKKPFPTEGPYIALLYIVMSHLLVYSEHWCYSGEINAQNWGLRRDIRPLCGCFDWLFHMNCSSPMCPLFGGYTVLCIPGHTYSAHLQSLSSSIYQ